MEHTNLVKRAIKGDEEAFETLIKDQHDKLYKTAFLYVRNKEDALDVVQDTVCKAFLSIKKLRDPEFFNTWLTKILIRTAYQLLNKKKTILTDDPSIFNISEGFSQNVDHQIDLSHAISTLVLHYQTVIVLFYYHDLPISRIAEIMAKPEGTVKTYLHRARIELKKVLEGVNSCEQKMV